MKIHIVAIMAYRAFLIGALMYTVGYLGWSAWWLLLLITMPLIDGKIECK